MTTPKVLITHPGRQHSQRLAMALANRGMLARYVTGVPARREALPAWQRAMLRKRLEAWSIDLDPRLVRHVLVAPLVRRLAGRVGSPAATIDWGHRAEAWFDRIAATEVRRQQPDLVVCYENAALETFRAAKRRGVTTVLDAASFHHAWQDRHYDPVESPAVHRRICQRKDDEIALADHVLTVSELARESYFDAGLPPDRVTAVRLGADLAAFRPTAEPREPGPIRFVFVGLVGCRKGMDVLLAATNQLQAAGGPVTVSAIGKPEPGYKLPDDDRVKGGGVRQLGWMPASALAKELPRHDVMVLPSRHDSFGMVVAEAMACGLPAIVSENVGAKELVTPGKSGLIVPASDAPALADAMRWFVENETSLGAMKEAAREAAAACDWAVYEGQVVDVLSGLAKGTRS